jgi:hypothetical protein
MAALNSTALTSGQTLGYIAFGQRVPTSNIQNSGIKAIILGVSSGVAVPDTTSGLGGDIVFQTTPNNTSNITLPERMRLTSDGNLGLGISSPNNNRLYIDKVISATDNASLNRGIYSSIQNSVLAATSEAISGFASGSGSSGTSLGVRGTGQNAPSNYGGYFVGLSGILANNYGVYAQAIGGVPGSVNYGIYARANFGGAGVTDWAGYFQGNVNINGSAFCTTSAWSSDKKLKKDIKPLLNGMDKIKLLKPSTYNFRIDEFKSLNLPSEIQLGLIAQELEQVFPELVTEIPAQTEMSKDGNRVEVTPEHKAVNYIGLIPVLISGVQEQQKLIETQQAQITNQTKANDDLKTQVNNLQKEVDALLNKTGNTTSINQLNTGAEGFALDQNIPNPFSQETVIKYTLTDQTKTATLNGYDLSGKQITSFPLTERGSSSITITSEKLAAGIYIYSVVADGKIMDSKRMVVAQK